VKEETYLQKIISWLYVHYVLMPKVREDYSVQINIMNDEEASSYLDNKDWAQNTANARQAMYEKMFEPEQ